MSVHAEPSRENRPVVPQTAPPLAAAPVPYAPNAQLRALQTMLNASPQVRQLRAVAALAAPPAAQPVLQLVTDVPVQILKTLGRVMAINIPTTTRPEGTMSNAEGSHATAWSAIVEGARNAVTGKTMPEAAQAVQHLFDIARALPGVARVADMVRDRQDAYHAALALAESKAYLADWHPCVETLQNFVSAYLGYRNLVPLSAIQGGSPANSGNEGRNLALLRDYQQQDAAVLKRAFLSLMDKKAVARYSEAVGQRDFMDSTDHHGGAIRASVDKPGVRLGEAAEQRVIDVIHQHLQTMAAGFPEAYAKAGLDANEVTDHYLGKDTGHEDVRRVAWVDSDESDEEDNIGEMLMDANDQAAGDSGIVAAGLTLPVPGNRGHALPSPLAKNTNSAVMIRTRLVYRGELHNVIEEVIIAKKDRPDGLFGGADKKHTSAWISFVEGFRHQLTGKTLAEAARKLEELQQAFKTLPGYAAQGFLTDEREEQFAIQNALAREAVTNAKNKPGRDSIQYGIQQLIALRNFIPFSAADTPQHGAGGKCENVDAILAYQTSTPLEIRTNIWGLLDNSTVVSFADFYGKHGGAKKRQPQHLKRGDGVVIDADLPGADVREGVNQRGAHVIRQHLMSIKIFYPEAYAKSDIEADASLEAFLVDFGVGDDLERQELAALLRP